ncbi:MAG: sensor histidine kinase [Luteimonas sp.]
MSDLHVPELEPTEMASLQRQLADCRAELLALRQAQATLAHGLSHDLRAPLRAIETFSGLVEADAALAPGTRAHVVRVRAAAARMGGLIEALLGWSHAHRAELRPEPVDLGLLVETAATERQEADPARPAQLQVEPGLVALGDERLLRMLATQLVDNAWKFSRDRDCVRIRLSGERIGERLHVALHDAGCGFDMRYADKVFQPFQRLLGPEEGGGHGLGLAIAHRIVERHGGRLIASSVPGTGSRFCFDLPAIPIAA